MAKTLMRIRTLLFDPDEATRATFLSINDGVVDASVHPSPWPGARVDVASDYDVVVIAVDSPAGLRALADLCARSDAPPVMAIAGAGFEGESLEYVLLLAEVRGAAATLTKPVCAAEFASAIRNVAKGQSGAPAPRRRSA